jgi:DNA-binding transcriptional ArsR family regulator
MAKKSFLLVSLKENKAKKLAEVISNKTCRKILDYLAEKKDATESQMSKDMAIPISTVHYNMKALVDAKLVKSDEYHYSSKGKEVSHYRLANQYVIIAPEGEKHMIREKLKSIIPTALIMGFAASVIKMFSTGLGAAKSAAAPMMLRTMEAGVAQEAAYEVAKSAADEAVVAGASGAMDNAAQAVPPAVQHVAERAPEVTSAVPEIALWFFIGAVAGVAVYLIVEYIVKRIRNR